VSALTIEDDVTVDLLRAKVPEIVLVGKIIAPKALIPMLQVLTTEKIGAIMTPEEAARAPKHGHHGPTPRRSPLRGTRTSSGRAAGPFERRPASGARCALWGTPIARCTPISTATPPTRTRRRPAARDLFARLATHRRIGRDGAGARTLWAVRVARNLLIDSYRRRAARQAEPLDDAPEPATPAEDRDAALDLEAAIARLPAEQREALALSALGGLTSAEIGEALGRPAGTVRYLLSLARKTLSDAARGRGSGKGDGMMDDIRTNLDERLAAWAGRHALSDARAEAIRRAVLSQPRSPRSATRPGPRCAPCPPCPTCSPAKSGGGAFSPTWPRRRSARRGRRGEGERAQPAPLARPPHRPYNELGDTLAQWPIR
jgi:RNA polymerase sigma-70 factor (ECF subfamily)